MERREFLRQMGLCTAGFLASPMVRAMTVPPNQAAPLPNIVFILIDDMGWADVGCFGNTFFETPNIDRLASEGMRFTNAYAACPVCSPTRASIMTGKYPARLHLTDFLKGMRTREGSPILPALYADELPLEEVTIAEALKPQGYATCHVGKWHLGSEPYWPEHQGFDVNIGGSGSGAPRSYLWPRWKDNPPIEGRINGEYLTDRLTEEACKFVEAHTTQPFFLYLSHYAVHIPLEGKEDKIAKYEEKKKAAGEAVGPRDNPIYAAMVESVDESVGKVLDTLKRTGIDSNTIVFFFSDNGGLSVHEGAHTPATNNWPLRDGKGYLYEGGVREPCIVRWPGVTKPGSACDTPVCSIDFFPTICDMARVTKPATNGPIDGIRITPLLHNPHAPLKRDALYWHYPHFSNQGGRPGAAIREGRWKLIERYEDGSLELYNLEKDLGETTNLAPKMPVKARQLHRKLVQWRHDVNANMPRPNPDYHGG